MPYYKPLREIESLTVRQRTLQGLKRLRQQLQACMPIKTREATLILGTWNIRNFDDNRFQNGPRSREDLHYIAEIISRFDVIAVQEICNHLAPLESLMYLLGNHYDYIVTDITESRGGNQERLGFIYDRRKVTFKGIAGELVLPDTMLITHEGKQLQFSRTPFMCAFQAGWFKFLFSTVHIYFGAASGVKLERRIQEIDHVAKFLAKRAKEDDQNHILVGDFNIESPDGTSFNALKNMDLKSIKTKKAAIKTKPSFTIKYHFESEKMNSIYMNRKKPKVFYGSLTASIETKISKATKKISKPLSKGRSPTSPKRSKRLNKNTNRQTLTTQNRN